jgi:hypothetical protein
MFFSFYRPSLGILWTDVVKQNKALKYQRFVNVKKMYEVVPVVN